MGTTLLCSRLTEIFIGAERQPLGKGITEQLVLH